MLNLCRPGNSCATTLVVTVEPFINYQLSKELILVGTAPGPNQVVMRPTIEGGGNVNLIVSGTEIAGPGFGYKLIKIVKEGVKTVNEQPIPLTHC